MSYPICVLGVILSSPYSPLERLFLCLLQRVDLFNSLLLSVHLGQQCSRGLRCRGGKYSF